MSTFKTMHIFFPLKRDFYYFGKIKRTAEKKSKIYSRLKKTTFTRYEKQSRTHNSISRMRDCGWAGAVMRFEKNFSVEISTM